MLLSQVLENTWTLSLDGMTYIAHTPQAPFAVALRREKTYESDRGTVKEHVVEAERVPLMEVAETEELFRYPLHPYTRSLMSAIPIPDPILEKKKKLFIYSPREYDANGDQPQLVDIGNGHMVYGDAAEIAEYKAKRFANGD